MIICWKSLVVSRSKKPSRQQIMYCVKVFKQRWYLLARNIGEGSLKIYALDRLHGLEQTGNNFELPKGFDAEGVFHDVIGIIIGGRNGISCLGESGGRFFCKFQSGVRRGDYSVVSAYDVRF